MPETPLVAHSTARKRIAPASGGFFGAQCHVEERLKSNVYEAELFQNRVVQSARSI
jgi:hypothetical protein